MPSSLPHSNWIALSSCLVHHNPIYLSLPLSGTLFLFFFFCKKFKMQENIKICVATSFWFAKGKIFFFPLKNPDEVHHTFCFQYKLRGWDQSILNPPILTRLRCAQSFPTLDPTAMIFLRLLTVWFRWIINKDLLRSAGNSTQYSVTTYTGNKTEEEQMHVSV